MSPRIQRLAMKLLKYEFTLTYVPGKKLQVPDTLSRDPTDDTINTDFLEANLRVYSVIATSPDNETRFKKATETDQSPQGVVACN